MYNLALDLTPEQKKQLKLRAAERERSIRAYVRDLILYDLANPIGSQSQLQLQTRTKKK
jgi:plasmid stability protein